MSNELVPTPKSFGSIPCMFCHRDIAMGPDTVVVCIFTKQIWFSYIWVKCPNCNGNIRYWADKDDYKSAVMIGCGLIEEEYPSDDEKAGYEEVKGLKEIPSYGLTPRMERQIAFLAWLLDNSDLSELDLPQPPRSLPKDWC